jgi:hypothetical protein
MIDFACGSVRSRTRLPMRQAVLDLEESKIREVANAGMGRSDVLAFWFGESDEVTPDFIREAAIASLQRARPSMPTTWACRSCARRSGYTSRCTARSAPSASPSPRAASTR